MAANNKKYDKAYVDTKGTDAYWRDPKSPKSGLSSVTAAKNLIRRKNNNNTSREKIPGAMEIYEKWMEPGYGGSPRRTSPSPSAEEQPQKDHLSPSRKDPKYKYHTDYSDQVKNDEKQKGYKYFQEYGKGVKEEDPWKDKDQHNYQPQPQQNPPPRSPKKEQMPDLMDIKEDPDYVEKKREKPPSPAPKPPTPVSKPPTPVKRPPTTTNQPPKPLQDDDDEDGEYADLYGWVSNGRDDDMDIVGKVLFEKQKKKK